MYNTMMRKIKTNSKQTVNKWQTDLRALCDCNQIINVVCAKQLPEPIQSLVRCLSAW